MMVLSFGHFVLGKEWVRNLLQSFGDFFVGKNSTLLIHEATLEDELEEEAVEKRHR